MLVAASADDGDPQRCIGAKVERRAELALRQHLKAQLAGMIGEVGQIVFGPSRGQIVVDGQLRLTVGVCVVGGAQHVVAPGDGVDGVAQPGHVQVAGDAVRQGDVEYRAGGVGHLDEPHAALPIGQSGDGRFGLRLRTRP